MTSLAPTGAPDPGAGPTKDPAEAGSIGRHMVRGSAWMIAMRWGMGIIGLISTIILARLLTPSDYGIAAMAALVVGLLQVLSSTQYDLALIQNRSTTRAHYDTAWTLQLGQGVLIALAIFFGAPLAQLFFDEPRLTDVLRVLSLSALIEGFTNIGVVDFRKELRFQREFWFYTLVKIVNFFIVVGLAVALRDYWALVLGVVAASAVRVVLSYVLHPFRPRLALSTVREIWSFSQWMLLYQVGTYLRNKLDILVVGRIGDAAQIGNYTVATDLAMLPTVELVMPIGRAMFPSFATLGGDRARLGSAFRRVLGAIASLCLPMGLGIAAVAHDAVTVVLGGKWAGAAPLIEWFGISGAMFGLAHVAGIFLAAAGRPRANAVLMWVQLAAIAAALPLAAFLWGVLEVAIARTVVTVLYVPLIFYAVSRCGFISRGQILAAIWRPLAASLAMVAAIWALPLESLETPALRLALHVALGATVYAAVLLALWRASGGGEGPERDALAILSARRRRTGRDAAQSASG